MNQSEFNKHIKKLQIQTEKDLKYYLKQSKIEENIRSSSGFQHFIFNLQKIIFELQHPFYTSIILGEPGEGKMIRGRKEEINIADKKFDGKNENQIYSHIREIIFYPETLSLYYEEKAHAELAIELDKEKFHHLYIKYEDELGICGYLAYGENVHFTNRYGMSEIEKFFQTEDEIGKIALFQANLWSDRFVNELEIRFVIEYVGKANEFSDFL